MHTLRWTLVCAPAGMGAGLAATGPVTAQQPVSIDSRFAEVNGIKLHYLIAGKGPLVLLVHGYAQNSHMWRPLMAELGKTHTVIAPDLRGFGQSDKPESGYDKPTMAQDVHGLAISLGHTRVGVVGHDIGLMVAYAYAAQYPNRLDGRFPSWRGRLDGRLAPQGPVAFSLLR
jgi:alpha-beta hydrolase superfamily lysophospholipase